MSHSPPIWRRHTTPAPLPRQDPATASAYATLGPFWSYKLGGKQKLRARQGASANYETAPADGDETDEAGAPQGAAPGTTHTEPPPALSPTPPPPLP